MDVAGIEVLITADKNLQFQQYLQKYPIQLVVLLTYDNRYKTLMSKVPLIEAELRKLEISGDKNSADRPAIKVGFSGFQSLLYFYQKK